jgi:hypothetical protein
MPIRERQAQTLHVGIARQQLRFDRGDLPEAAFHSRRYSRALQFDLGVRAAVAI